MAGRHLSALVAWLAIILLCFPFTGPAAAQTALGPNIIDAEFMDGVACWQDTEFVFSAVNPRTGALKDTPARTPIPAAPFTLTSNGPEILRTTNGIECVGTALVGDTPQIVRFDLAGGALVPGTEGLRSPMAPAHAACSPLRYYARYPDNQTAIIEDGEVRPLGVNGYAMRWLNCDELLLWRRTGYVLVDVGTKATTPVSALNVLTEAFPLTTSSGDRLIVIANGTQADLYRDGPEGWTLDRSLKSPDKRLPNFFSTELFEWQGRVWISGVIAKGGSRSQSKVVLYDTKRKKWKTVGKGGNLYPDPETLPLSSGNLGVYFWFAGEDTTKYMTVRP